MSEVNAPQLRFPEFKDDWNLIKLEDNAIIKGRIGWKNLKSEEYTDVGPSLIAGKHIHNGIINWDECDHITIERYDESPEIALQNGDIIFSKDGSLGNPALIKDLKVKATINGTMMLVRLDENKINPNYFYQILNSDYFFRLLHILKSGSSIPHIFQRDLVNFKFPLCPLEEQKKISNFLELIDKKIELLEKSINNYTFLNERISKLLFNKLIPIDNYVQVKDIFKSISTKNYQIKSSEIKELGKIPVVNQGKNKIAGYSDDCSKICIDIPLIIFGDHTTTLKYIDFDFIVGADGVKLLKPKTNDSIKYLYYALKQYNIEPEGYKRHFTILKDVELPLPSEEEQNYIVNILDCFDLKINLLNKQLDYYHNFKKGLLQKMFV